MTVWHLIEISLLSSVLSTVASLMLLPNKYLERMFGFAFDRRLTNLRSEQNQKIEQLKEQLNNLADRSRRSNEKEYVALDESWEAFVSANQATMQCITSFFEVPEFISFSDEEIRSWLKLDDFSDMQIRMIIEASPESRGPIYRATLHRRWAAMAHNAIYDARLRVTKASPYIPNAIRDLLIEKIQIMARAQVEQHFDISFERFGDARNFDDRDKFTKNNFIFVDEVAAAVQNQITRVNGHISGSAPS